MVPNRKWVIRNTSPVEVSTCIEIVEYATASSPISFGQVLRTVIKPENFFWFYCGFKNAFSNTLDSVCFLGRMAVDWKPRKSSTLFPWQIWNGGKQCKKPKLEVHYPRKVPAGVLDADGRWKLNFTSHHNPLDTSSQKRRRNGTLRRREDICYNLDSTTYRNPTTPG